MVLLNGMKNAWLLVIEELITFVKIESKRFFFGVVPTPFLDITNEINIQTPVAMSSVLATPPPVFSVLPTIPDILHEPVVMYVSVEQTICFAHSHDDFDGALVSFPYGSAVTVVSFFGRYARIQRQEIVGWILKDELLQNKSQVWPLLSPKMVYEAMNDSTVKIRYVIEDLFRAGKLSLPLQPGEYIVYRLRQDNRFISWPLIRPRTPGSWQKILRGVRGIHIGITPKTDTIMEWFTEAGVGKLAYVEKVSPDNTLTLSMVGQPEAGLFSATDLAEDVWRELRPVFIEIK